MPPLVAVMAEVCDSVWKHQPTFDARVGANTAMCRTLPCRILTTCRLRLRGIVGQDLIMLYVGVRDLKPNWCRALKSCFPFGVLGLTS